LSKPVKIIDTCSGLNTVADPFQPQTATDMTEMVNVVVSDSGKIELAFGHTKALSLTNGHSLFCDDSACLVCDGTSLYQVLPDLSDKQLLRSGLSGERLDHARYGPAIYYSNAYERGVVHEWERKAWNVEPYWVQNSKRYFESTVPAFEHIEMHHGHMLGSIGNALYRSEIGSPGLFSSKIPVLFPSRIIMIKHVESGVFVSDESQIWFLRGIDPHKFALGDPVSPYPVVEWGDCQEYINGSEVAGYEQPGQCALWISREGLCMGTNTGQHYNLTRQKIIYPSSGRQGAALIRGFQVIHTLR